MRRTLSRLLCYMFLSLHLFACTKTTHHIYYLFVNNSEQIVELLYPRKAERWAPYLWGDMNDINPNDTTMNSAGKAHFTFWDCQPFSRLREDSGYSSIEEMAPYDTVRIFIYDGSYHYLPVPENTPDLLFEKDEYYCRYDLTRENLYSLINLNGEIEICYPPDCRMAHVKMWPPYEQIVQTNE